jgi:hypothetical protein
MPVATEAIISLTILELAGLIEVGRLDAELD